MYAFIDGIQFTGSIAVAIYSIIQKKLGLGIASGVFFLVYPVLNQLIYSGLAKLCSNTSQRFQPSKNNRLVYHPKYNISFCGLQKMHPFDSQKYGNVVAKLLQYGIVTQKKMEKPGKISRAMLLEKMSAWYLMRLAYTIPLCLCIQMPLFFIPNFLLRWRVLDPMLYATQGSLIACQIADKLKWSINLAGGYHHASCKNGGGFCIYPDITLAVNYIRTRLSKTRIMIIDLDAHQGNGYERDMQDDHDIYIVDCYNHNIYPGDKTAKRSIKMDLIVNHFTSDSDYLNQLRLIQKPVQQFCPQFIIYNAGTDCLDGDPLGNLSLSKDCIIKRDEYIINLGLEHNIPVVMLLSGGYQRSNAGVIAESIKNLYQKFN